MKFGIPKFHIWDASILEILCFQKKENTITDMKTIK